MVDDSHWGKSMPVRACLSIVSLAEAAVSQNWCFVDQETKSQHANKTACIVFDVQQRHCGREAWEDLATGAADNL